MIVDVEKYIIFGCQQDLDIFFSLAQRAGFIEFLGGTRKKTLQLPSLAKTFFSAIKISKHYVIHPQEAPNTNLSISQVAEKIVSQKNEQEVLLEQERLILLEISRIAIFGDFSRQELNHLEKDSNRVFQFFCMKSDLYSEFSLPSEVIHVGTDYDLDYFVAINQEPKQYPKMIEIIIEKPLGELKDDLKNIREEIAKLELSIRLFANYLPLLESGLVELLNEHHLQLAKNSVSKSFNDGLFYIEAWVPKTKEKSLHALLGNLNVHCEKIAIEKNDSIPTCMENRGAAKIGQDILGIFDTPAHTDQDPSMWILVFFSLFFAMIVADAGYGLIFLAISLVLRLKFPDVQGIKKRMVKLSLVLSSCAIFWGVITGSYFGLSISPDSSIQKFSALSYLVNKKADYHLSQKDDVYEFLIKTYPQIETAASGTELLSMATKKSSGHVTYPVFTEFSQNILLDFSFVIGIIHLSLSFFRYLRRNFSGLGWVLFMIGGYLYFPSIIDATVIPNFLGIISKQVAYFWGFRLLLGGIGFAFIAALIQKGWHAFHELLHVIQVFADALSYLRLYALALGGMVMAHTFNDALGIEPGFFATLIIILFGHSINIMICLMGSVVHGLRLNFLEWFHYSFEGGGRLFNPLKLNKSK